MDGATSWQQLRQITLPMIARSTYICWILMTIFCVNDFPTIFLLTGGGPVDATNSLVVLAYRTVFQNQQIGPGVAIAFMMTRGPGVHLHPALPADPKGSDLMAIIHQTAEIGHVAEEHQQQLTTREKGTRGQWWRFVLILFITIVALVPVAVVLFLAFTPSVTSTTSGGFTLENFSNVFANTDVVLAAEQPAGHPRHRHRLRHRRRPRRLRPVPRPQQGRLRLLAAALRRSRACRSSPRSSRCSSSSRTSVSSTTWAA